MDLGLGFGSQWLHVLLAFAASLADSARECSAAHADGGVRQRDAAPVTFLADRQAVEEIRTRGAPLVRDEDVNLAIAVVVRKRHAGRSCRVGSEGAQVLQHKAAFGVAVEVVSAGGVRDKNVEAAVAVDI